MNLLTKNLTTTLESHEDQAWEREDKSEQM